MKTRFLVSFASRDVAGNHRKAVGGRVAVHFKPQIKWRGVLFKMNRGLLGQRAVELYIRLAAAGFREHLPQILANQLFRSPAGQPGSPFVDVHAAPLRVDSAEAVADV